LEKTPASKGFFSKEIPGLTPAAGSENAENSGSLVDKPEGGVERGSEFGEKLLLVCVFYQKKQTRRKS